MTVTVTIAGAEVRIYNYKAPKHKCSVCAPKPIKHRKGRPHMNSRLRDKLWTN